jgi:hypothetical protein
MTSTLLEQFNAPVTTIEFKSLGKVTDRIGLGPKIVVDDRPSIMDEYPSILVVQVDKMDVYLAAYYNTCLSELEPDLKFSYTDPGHMTGHLGELRNAIKLAFLDQYMTVRECYLRHRKDIITSLEQCEAITFLEKNEYGPEQFNQELDAAFSKIRAESILDITGYRGSGYFLIWHDPEATTSTTTADARSDTLYALPTIGLNGHFLPEPGYNLVLKYGWHYFRNTEIIGFQVGHIRKVMVENDDNGEWEPWELKAPIYVEVADMDQDDDGSKRVDIDGMHFQANIYGETQ